MWTTLTRLGRHLWLDRSHTARAIPAATAERLRQRIAASEQRHSGEVRICVEASLPASYLWRHLRQRLPIRQIVRQRALMMFSKLRVWDTEHNNGVLIYLLLAEHRIEIVADRGLQRHASAQDWQEVVSRLGQHLRRGDFENGLTQALEEVSALLVAHFPRTGDVTVPNELPNTVVRA